MRLPVLGFFCVAAAAWAADPHADTFAKDVAPFLQKRCVACHNEGNKTADVNLDALRKPERALAEQHLWEDVLDKIRSGEMPPPGMPRPKEAELLAATHWMEAQIARAEKASKPDPGRVTARRLNKTEYNNTIRDLLGISFLAADDFPNDDSGYGFDNIGDVLSLSPVLMEKYLAAAEKISQIVIPLGKLPKPTAARVASDQARPDPSQGGMRVTHRFPYWAEYEIQGRAVLRGQDAPPARYALFLDGKLLQTAEIVAGPTGNRNVTVRVPVAPGDHHLRAAFVNAKNEPVTAGERTDILSDYIEVRGPYPNPALGLPEAQKKLFVCAEKTEACATKIVAALLPRAWRRPVTKAEIAKIAGFVKMAQADGESFERGVQVALQAALVSPHFLFRVERDAKPGDVGAVHPISDFELATRLSYFLWSSMPDAELFRAARAGTLRTPEVLRAQVKRMLADTKSDALVENFAGQWLLLRNMEVVKPDPEKFPDFDEALRDAMMQETRLFFASVLREDRPVLEFLNAPYTFLNERLAKHYGIPGVQGDEFRRVMLSTDQRGGLLAQGSVLTVSSYPTRTSPVLRGKWILENILGAPPPPPPPGVPELDASKVGTEASLREQLQKHRANPSCAVCHNKMDALGFGLENYDAVGAWRTKDGNFPIDAAGALPGNRTFTTPAEMRGLIAQEGPQFAKCLTEKMLTYALGRGLEKYDRSTTSKICNKLATDDYRMSALILGIVESLPFQNRRGDGKR